MVTEQEIQTAREKYKTAVSQLQSQVPTSRGRGSTSLTRKQRALIKSQLGQLKSSQLSFEKSLGGTQFALPKYKQEFIQKNIQPIEQRIERYKNNIEWYRQKRKQKPTESSYYTKKIDELEEKIDNFERAKDLVKKGYTSDEAIKWAVKETSREYFQRKRELQMKQLQQEIKNKSVEQLLGEGWKLSSTKKYLSRGEYRIPIQYQKITQKEVPPEENIAWVEPSQTEPTFVVNLPSTAYSKKIYNPYLGMWQVESATGPQGTSIFIPLTPQEQKEINIAQYKGELAGRTLLELPSQIAGGFITTPFSKKRIEDIGKGYLKMINPLEYEKIGGSEFVKSHFKAFKENFDYNYNINAAQQISQKLENLNQKYLNKEMNYQAYQKAFDYYSNRPEYKQIVESPEKLNLYQRVSQSKLSTPQKIVISAGLGAVDLGSWLLAPVRVIRGIGYASESAARYKETGSAWDIAGIGLGALAAYSGFKGGGSVTSITSSFPIRAVKKTAAVSLPLIASGSYGYARYKETGSIPLSIAAGVGGLAGLYTPEISTKLKNVYKEFVRQQESLLKNKRAYVSTSAVLKTKKKTWAELFKKLRQELEGNYWKKTPKGYKYVPKKATIGDKINAAKNVLKAAKTPEEKALALKMMKALWGEQDTSRILRELAGKPSIPTTQLMKIQRLAPPKTELVSYIKPTQVQAPKVKFGLTSVAVAQKTKQIEKQKEKEKMAIVPRTSQETSTQQRQRFSITSLTAQKSAYKTKQVPKQEEKTALIPSFSMASILSPKYLQAPKPKPKPPKQEPPEIIDLITGRKKLKRIFKSKKVKKKKEKKKYAPTAFEVLVGKPLKKKKQKLTGFEVFRFY